jgi:hypothetical protein
VCRGSGARGQIERGNREGSSEAVAAKWAVGSAQRAPSMLNYRARQVHPATRGSGYKGTASAISELVDNSIQAGATRIALTIAAKTSDDEDSSIEVSVLDNGCGMDAATLPQALRFGGSSRFGDRRGLGRYAMGLPNASLSQAKRVTVFTWQRSKHSQRESAPRRRVYSSYLDVDEIVRCEMTEVPAPQVVKSPPVSCASTSGTLVCWSGCDRLDNRRASTIVRKLEAASARGQAGAEVRCPPGNLRRAWKPVASRRGRRVRSGRGAHERGRRSEARWRGRVRHNGALRTVNAKVGDASFECLYERDQLLGAQRSCLELGLDVGACRCGGHDQEIAPSIFQPSSPS